MRDELDRAEPDRCQRRLEPSAQHSDERDDRGRRRAGDDENPLARCEAGVTQQRRQPAHPARDIARGARAEVVAQEHQIRAFASGGRDERIEAARRERIEPLPQR